MTNPVPVSVPTFNDDAHYLGADATSDATS